MYYTIRIVCVLNLYIIIYYNSVAVHHAYDKLYARNK